MKSPGDLILKVNLISLLLLVLVFQNSCERLDMVKIIKIETLPVINITSTTAILRGNIIDPGEGIVEYGYYYWEDGNETNPSMVSEKSNKTGEFQNEIGNLKIATKYHVKSFAADRNEKVFGNPEEFTTLATGNFTDSRDDHVYNWVKIGGQIWMAENLAYLPQVCLQTEGSYTDFHYYVYGYDGNDVNEAKTKDNFTIYGVLYNWPAAMSGSVSSHTNPSGVQGICPSGWHLPSDAEWAELYGFLGGKSVAGGKLKEGGYSHWASPNDGASNSSGFNALPGGHRYPFSFGGLGEFGIWLSSTEFDEIHPYYLSLHYLNPSADFTQVAIKECGFSVRCIKDE